MEDLVIKNNDGNYTITASGEKELYFITARKLIQYYLKQVLKRDPNSVSETSAALSGFMLTNFKKIEHYLQKLPEIATLIQEPNLDRFQKFMGQYFITTLQKEKSALINRETGKIREKLENPFWTPSHELLKSIGSFFIKSPALNFKTTEISGADTAAEKIDVVDLPRTNTPMPKTPAVEIKADAKAENSVPAFPEISESLTDPPGAILLKELAALFLKAPQLELSGGLTEASDRLPVDKHILSLKDFAGLLNQVNKFSRSQDNAGYQTWYTGLTSKQKAVVKFNGMYNAEKKGKVVNWGQEIMIYAAATSESKDELYQIVEEVKLYNKIINNIRHSLMNNSGVKLSAQVTSSIYSQSIYILSDTQSAAEKKSAIDMLLLQVTDESFKQTLSKNFEKIISVLN